jgi:hypothetical protein
MAEPISLTISIIALALSATTAWLTLFRRGRVRMTQPTVIFFGPDGGTSNRPPRPKVFLRTLLFCSAKRGSVIERVHVKLSRGETRQNFNIWVHGDEKLVRGSGLFVGETGVAANHHFLLPEDAPTFAFTAGSYSLEVFARILGEKQQRLLFSQTLEITDVVAAALREADAGLYFDWGPDSAKYLSHVDIRAAQRTRDPILDFLSNASAESHEPPSKTIPKNP